MKRIRSWALVALTLPLSLPLFGLGLAWPAPAASALTPAVPATDRGPGQVPDEDPAQPVPCRCNPSLLLFGPFGCECSFDLLVSALKPGKCTDLGADPSCSPLTRCRVSVRLWWVGEDEGCETPPKPLFAPMKASCGSFSTQAFLCPAGPGLVTAFLLCLPCKP